ncbi:hypothetical protein [Thiohalophilus sp.]|uniref:hypothetical protein n=1 Tax=Thiohalophilus sp. TaxID=3028392 RepID=UPI002ACD9C69|nr:hypothetical protein [Thiohalophilus sp.]MDZ7662951.1 hypothetical protein [Thiohalophilus sp.]
MSSAQSSNDGTIWFGIFIGIILTLITIIIIATISAEDPAAAEWSVVKWVNDNHPIFQTIGSLAIAGSAIVAFFLYRLNQARHSHEDKYKASETFLKESIRILERSYEIFTDNGKHIFPPRNDRLLWLTTARMILRFDRLKSRITENEHKEIIDEHEEYWRFQFYKLMDFNNSNFTKAYFCPSGNQYDADTIAINSIAIIFSFAKWKEGNEDPLRAVDDKMLFAKGAIPIDQFGVLDFLEGYSEYWGEVQVMKEEVLAKQEGK